MAIVSEQRMGALEKANGIRVQRARLKRELTAGRDLAEVILDPPDWLLSARPYDFFLSLPRVGCVKAQRLFRLADVPALRTFGGLTPRQRAALAKVAS